MKKVTVQAYEDRSRSEGGHAVILLQGVTQPKGLVAFRIRPTEAARASGGQGGWVGGEHLPIAVASTDYGLELVAGPEVTESEHLLPGTVVEIQIPASGVRGEFLWPNIAPVMRPKRKTLAVNKRGSRVDGHAPGKPHTASGAANGTEAKPSEKAVNGAGEHAQGAPRTATSGALAADEDGLLELPAFVLREPVRADQETFGAKHAAVAPDTEELSMPDQAIPSTTETPAFPAATAHAWVEPERPAVKVAEASAADHHAQGPEPAPASAPQADPATADRGHHAHYSADEISRQHGWAFKKDLSVMLDKKFFALGASRHDAIQDEALRATSETWHHTIAADATAILAHEEEARHAGSKPILEPIAAPAAGAASSYVANRADDFRAPVGSEMFSAQAHAGSNALAGAAPAGKWPAEQIVLSILAALGIGGFLAIMLMTGRGADTTVAQATPSSVAAPAISSAAGTAPVIAPAAVPVIPRPETTLLFDALTAGATSPQGVSAQGASVDKALENANTQLLAPAGQRDTDEGAFWLKHYISGALGDNRTVRVLTQLGSVYAEPTSGTPDYTKARLVWEIASSAGDPVAMCFLGLLYENGLGVGVDKKAALDWYQRSKDKGGCSGVDESLARLRK